MSHAPNSNGVGSLFTAFSISILVDPSHPVFNSVLYWLPLSVLEALSDLWLGEDTQCCVYRGQALEKVSYQHALCWGVTNCISPSP